MPDLDPFPKLTAIPKTGALTCGYTGAGAEPCGRPAVWHIAWRLTPKADFSLVCPNCLTVVQQTLVYVDIHPARTECDVPGTGWLSAKPSRCVWLTDASATAQREARTFTA
ncbi:hypothetical protein ACFWIB_14605 [Streptomyces sp. NPDC127051]|uniref:hypothetical protein n=1 Tax=Streptomyces sp. NPDC127051 TaxID=3347119 RepID=UPI0036640F01